MGLTVTDINVPTLLEKLHKREWLVPRFQRDFVWTTAAVTDLLISILESRPIGMATLWEQSSNPEVELLPVNIPDFDPLLKKTTTRHFGEDSTNPSKLFAILDGRQRCTAIAMAFGGLRALDGKYRFAGRYYLDVSAKEPSERVVFHKESDVKKLKLDVDAQAISKGLFPLTSNREGEEILPQWMRYLQALHNPTFYSDGKLPEKEELERRDGILKEAFEGLVGTKLAVYVVPETYHLAAICEIFETLNTTGTKVSTVDLIHSWLYSDTSKDPEGPILLRDWISEFGQKDGAIGWASTEDRPELVAQIVTACYVALNKKDAPRRIGGNSTTVVSSLKAADLLATPTVHWKNVIHHEDLLAEFMGDFQRVTAGGFFPYSACPYPISAAIYVALRWHAHFENDAERVWGRDDLDSLFRAFFWRNALTNRYDQGFLTQLGADIKELKILLSKRSEFNSANKWAAQTQQDLEKFMGPQLPSRQQLFELVTDGRPLGAMQKALTLPMIGSSRQDLLDANTKLSFPATDVEMHHIYPKSWCANNRIGALAEILDKERAGKDWVDSTSNLLPLSRKSNNAWKARVPGQALKEHRVTFEHVKQLLKALYIDEVMFRILLDDPSRVGEFWSMRADLIVTDLIDRTKISL